MVIYLAGPMTGLPDYNRAAFNACAARLEQRGFSVLNPATLPDGLSHDAYMRIDEAMLKEADVVVLLDGWQESKGAVWEVKEALRLGKRVRMGPYAGDFETDPFLSVYRKGK